MAWAWEAYPSWPLPLTIQNTLWTSILFPWHVHAWHQALQMPWKDQLSMFSGPILSLYRHDYWDRGIRPSQIVHPGSCKPLFPSHLSICTVAWVYCRYTQKRAATARRHRCHLGEGGSLYCKTRQPWADTISSLYPLRHGRTHHRYDFPWCIFFKVVDA